MSVYLLALVQQQTDPWTSAKHAETGFDLVLLRAMRLDDKDDLPDHCGHRRCVAAHHTGRGIKDNEAIRKTPCHFI